MAQVIQMDFKADTMVICASRLASAGYQNSGGTEADLRAYLSVLDRRVPRRKRYIYKAAGYSVPNDLVSGEQQFLKAVQDGVDLRPYQSTRLDDPSFTDGMLSDFGLQHFHVGVGPHPTKPAFKARTDPVLFAMIDDDSCYCIGFYHHPPHDPFAWSRQGVLDLIHDNWPHLLAPFVAQGTTALAHSPTDEDLAALRKSGINAFTQRPDGTVHMCPGLGVTLAGGSLKTTMGTIKLGDICRDLELLVEQRFANQATASQSIPASAHLREANGSVAIQMSDGTTISVRDFAVPPI